MKRILRAFAISLSLFTATNMQATHLVGGNIGYVYLGETVPGSGLYAYQVYMEFYLNCGDDSNWQSLGELVNAGGGSLPLGVYTQDPLNPNADKDLFTTADMFLVDSLDIIPDLPDGCVVGEGLCTKKGYFTGQVVLPLSFSGYHLYFHNFSRNITIDNIFDPNQTGIGYYAFIPPTLVNNSSPVWIGIPTPFLCISDTTTFINSASDPDGDQLIFSFQTPYNSVTQQGGIQPPPGQLPWPIPEVTWNPGFSTAQPFGAGGYSFINGATGLTSYLPPIQGNYVVAVEVKEFRNGQLIGITRRDLQLQAIICPPNNTPEISGALPTSYTVNAGDQLCFDMAFSDIDADSLFLNSSGTIFDTQIFNPAATIVAGGGANGEVSAQFCWNTACDQGQDQPYLFSVSVNDNGCPPKNVDVVFQINVVPFVGPQVIDGPLQVCTQQSGVIYSTPPIAGADFTWTVNGGNITAGQGTNSITVDWGAPGPGSVILTATNDLGCTSAPVNISVNIADLPPTSAGADATICLGDNITLGGAPTGPPGSSYAWTPNGSLNDASIANPTATPTGTTDYIVSVSNTGCVNKDTIHVTVSIPTVDAGPNTAACDGDTAQLNATGLGGFAWSPGAGLSDTDIPDPLAFPTVTTTYIVTLTDSIGCVVTDSVVVTVNTFDQNISIDPGNTSGCEGDTAIFTAIPDAAGNTYVWTANGNITIQGASGNSTIVQWNTPGPGTLTVLITDANGCSATIDTPFETLAIPDVDAGSDTTICAGQSVQLNGSGNGSLLWSPIFGLSDPTIANPIANPEATQVYTLTVTGGNLCTNSDQTTVTVNVLPNANAGPDLEVCLGDSVQLLASGPGSYSWSPAATLSDPNATNPYASPLVTTTYTLTLTDSVTCSDNDQVTVTVNSFDQNPSVEPVGQTTACEDITQTFTVLPDVAGNTYAWSSTGSISITGTAGSGVDILYATAGPGTLSVVITDANGCSSAPITIDLLTLDRPDADAGPDVTYCVGDSIQLGGTPTGPVGSIYGWYSPSNSITDTTLANPYIAAGTSEEVYVFVALGQCVDIDTVQVNLSQTVANAGQDALICAGSSAQLNASGGIGYSWSPVNDLSDPNIADPIATPAATISYVVTVTNADQCVATDTVQVIVTPAADPGADDSVIMCQSGSIFNLTDSLGGAPQAGGTWTDPANNPHADTFDPATDPTGAWTYTITGSGGCADTSATLVITLTNPDTQISGDNTICFGDTTQLVNTGNVSWSWTPTTGISDPTIGDPLFFPGSTTTYSVTVTDANGCVGTGSTVLTVNPLPQTDAGADVSICIGENTVIGGSPTGPNGSNYTWTPAAGLNNDQIANPTAQPGNTTIYTVQVVDPNQCANADSIVVTVVPLPQIDAGGDTSFCQGGSVQLQAIGSGTFTWSPTTGLSDPNIANPVASPGSTTTYVVTLGGNTCVNTDTITVVVLGLPTADAGSDLYLCPGFDVQLQGNGSGSPAWSPASTLDDPTVFDPLASPLTTTTYTLTITDGNGCTMTDAVQVDVNTDPPADAGPDQSICEGEQVVLGGNPTNITGTTVLWSPNAALDDPTLSNPTASPIVTTLYTVTVTSDTCTSQDNVLITLQGVAEAAFTLRLEPGCENLRAFFTDLSSGASQWLWEFGDGTTSTDQNPQHFFPYGQPIVVTLTVTDGFGCTGTITQTYPIGAFSDLVDYEIPNVFTPNGDGKNDVFTVNSNGVLGPCVSLLVFNRWGQKVFESFGNDLVWGGRNFAGEECVTGTYFYTLTLKDMTFNGTVYLNR